MNILYTESSPNIGGQELQAIAQMRAMQRLGHTVMLACREYSRISAEARHHDISVVHIPFRNSLHLPSVSALMRLITRFRPAMVVTHSGHDSNTVGLARALLAGRVRRFFIIRQKTYLTRKMRMFSLNHMCDVVVVPGKDIRERLVSAECLKPVCIVSPGFDFARLREELKMPVPESVRNWLAHTGTDPVIVQTGMLRPEKGHDFMLRVLHRLKDSGVSFRWLIAGTGRPEEEASLRTQIEKMGMDDCVLMCGRVTPVVSLYREAALMVMPSRNESFGMAVVEAAVCGVPVMASDAGGIPDILRNGRHGTLLPPDDEEAWLNALTTFFNNPAHMLSMAFQARWDMEVRYSIDATVLRLLELWQCYHGEWRHY